jgi:hypothetical protein
VQAQYRDPPGELERCAGHRRDRQSHEHVDEAEPVCSWDHAIEQVAREKRYEQAERRSGDTERDDRLSIVEHSEGDEAPEVLQGDLAREETAVELKAEGPEGCRCGFVDRYSGPIARIDQFVGAYPRRQ